MSTHYIKQVIIDIKAIGITKGMRDNVEVIRKVDSKLASFIDRGVQLDREVKVYVDSRKEPGKPR